MAIAIFELSVSCRPTFIIRSVFCSSQKGPLFLPRPSSTAPSQPFQIRQNLSPTPLRIRWSCAAAIETLDEGELIIKPAESQSPVREWKKVSSRELGISTSAISGHTRTVLKELKRNGYEVYLVGGCVRDLILKRVPKDFDILTTAELREIVDIFPHSEIVGRRFPICHVRFGDNIVEVSSFNSRRQTCSRNLIPFVRPIDCDEKDNIRWRNCLQRDFTINGLMFDPFARLVYDYMGGLEDIRKAKVRTIIPSSMSFHEDCARILRAIRIAARLGFRLARRTAQSVRDLSCSILRLDRARLLMEMNYMLAYGSAEASVRLLWKFGLLEILLPHQAAYLVRSGFQRTDKGTNMLLVCVMLGKFLDYIEYILAALFANLDKLLAPDKPCHSSLWVAILAFHHALSTCARDPSVIAAFSLAVNNGGDISEAVEITTRISRPCEQGFHELLEPRKLEKAELKEQVIDLVASVDRALSDMTDEGAVSTAMAKYPQAPHSNLVFIPLGLYLKVCRIFECIGKGKERGLLAKQGGNIDYDRLALGSLEEVRHIFARVVFDTIYPLESGS